MRHVDLERQSTPRTGHGMTRQSQRPYLYVGNLASSVTERVLARLFADVGEVRSVKIVTGTPRGDGERDPVRYGFVEYTVLQAAEAALHEFQGRRIGGRRLRLNWAHQGADAGEPAAQTRERERQQAMTNNALLDPASTSLDSISSNTPLSPLECVEQWVGELQLGDMQADEALSTSFGSPPFRRTSLDSSSLPLSSPFSSRQQRVPRPVSSTGTGEPQLYSVFVGDLAPEINDAALAQAFAIFPSLYDARIMWDLQSHRSRGFGFVRFTDATDASNSISTMTGHWLGSRPLRVNWASRRQRPAVLSIEDGSTSAGSGSPGASAQQAIGYEALRLAPAHVATVYVGNLPAEVTITDVVSPYERFGRVLQAEVHEERHFAFITLDSHENAARAVAAYSTQSLMIHGRLTRTGWGRYARPSSIHEPSTP